MELKGRRVEADVADVHAWDYPDFCDAHFTDCTFEDGTSLSDEEVEELSEKYQDVLWDRAFDSLH